MPRTRSTPLILKTKPYDPEKDFTPVSLLVVVPNVLVVNPQLSVNNVQELIALLKAEPDKYAYASSGNGTPLHLSGELFKAMAGVGIQHIPDKGAGPALNDVVGNQVPIMFDNLPSSSSHIKGGTLKAWASPRPSGRRPSPTYRQSPKPACRAMRPIPGTRCLRPPARRRRLSIA
ncbi:MFS transporter [Aminobacter sp. Y103A]|uniref:MFS transporter n=1 Tax=Aminobacter aminovorans TaxID=83263 RepID=A0AAC9AQY3_AMIAI|nr:MFS transporter [Aminobacter aminovorans]MBB3705750.1 tripartite-type tricarboxylate transporter receptor subunit TctC [Aminobacter aminovorans]BBD39221.1 MFS transporter [Aminobacter sp. SS-2016]